MAALFHEAQSSALKQAFDLLLKYSAPSNEMVQSDWFGLALGAWNGLAQRILTMVIVVTMLLMQFSPARDHGRSLARVVTSIIGLVLFAQVFYPIYSILSQLREVVGKTIIAQFMDGGDVKSLLSVLAPSNVMGAIVSAGLGMFVFGAMAFVALALNIAGVIVLVTYPMAIVLRPLPFGDRMFHFANGVLVTTLVSGPVMIFWLVMGHKVSAVSDQYVPGGGMFVDVIAQLATGSLAVITPYVILTQVKRTSSQVFGRVDSHISGAVTMKSSGPVPVRIDTPDSQRRRPPVLKEAVAAAVREGVSDQGSDLSLTQRLKAMATTAATTAAVASGNPVVAAAAQLVRNRPASSRDNGGE